MMIAVTMTADPILSERKKTGLGFVREVAQLHVFYPTMNDREGEFAEQMDTFMSAAAVVDEELACKLGEAFIRARSFSNPWDKAWRLNALLATMAEHVAILIPPTTDETPCLLALATRLTFLKKEHASLLVLGDQANDQELATKVEGIYKEFFPLLVAEGVDLMPFLVLAQDPVWPNRRHVLFDVVPAVIARCLRT